MRKQVFNPIKYIASTVLCCAWLSIAVASGATETISNNDKIKEQKSYELETIMVTADKRTTAVQKTPMAITVFTEQDLEDNNIRTVGDALKWVPNLIQVTDLIGNTRVTFRGALASTATETSPMVMYVDGVPVDSYAFLDANLLDIERIEVLRGAQSAIYGKNAFAGVVNVISKKPDNTSRGKAFADAGTEYSHGFGGTVSGPVIEDKLFFSVSGSHFYRDGYMEPGPKSSESNHERNVRMTGQLRWLPTDVSEMRLHMQYTQLRQGPQPYMVGEEPTLDSVAYGTDHKNMDILNLALHGSVDTENMTMKSITTFRRDILTSSLNTKPSLASLGLGSDSVYDDTSTEFTQEFRLQSPDGADGIAWLAGLYGGYRDFNRKQFDAIDDDGNRPTSYPYVEETYEFAPFAQAVVPLFTEGLNLTAGLRWQYVKRDALLQYLENNRQDLIFQASPSETWSEFLPRLILSYDVTDSHMVYAGVNRGFLPGGFNRYTPSDIPFTYDPQFAWNYEAGAKTAWFDRRLNANLTLFYSQYSDMHVQQWNQSLNNGLGATQATNAGEVTAYGAEFELEAQLLPGLRGMAALGYTQAEYDDFQTQLFGGLPADYSGNRVEWIPEYTGNVSLLYRHDSGFMCQAGVLYTDKIYWGPENTDERDAVTTVNAKVGYETESFDVYLYGTNIFDERYSTAYIPNLFNTVGHPQEFGLRLVYRW